MRFQKMTNQTMTSNQLLNLKSNQKLNQILHLIKTETDEIPTSDVYVNSDIESDTEVTPPVSDDETIPYIGDSDTETITYTTPNRIRAKKRALKTLAKKRAKKLQSTKKKNNKKTHSCTDRCSNDIERSNGHSR